MSMLDDRNDLSPAFSINGDRSLCFQEFAQKGYPPYTCIPSEPRTTLRLCQHVMADKRPCQAPALRLYDYCRHHRRYYQTAPLPEYARPALGNPRDITRAILRGVDEMLNHNLELASFQKMVNLFAKEFTSRRNRL